MLCISWRWERRQLALLLFAFVLFLFACQFPETFHRVHGLPCLCCPLFSLSLCSFPPGIICPIRRNESNSQETWTVESELYR